MGVEFDVAIISFHHIEDTVPLASGFPGLCLIRGRSLLRHRRSSLSSPRLRLLATQSLFLVFSVHTTGICLDVILLVSVLLRVH